MVSLNQHILPFLKGLSIKEELPNRAEALTPYDYSETWELTQAFYNTYYATPHQRKVILGINPGRLGAGLTGIPFTDPVQLEEVCNIPNNLPKKHELSAIFFHKVIEAYGGCIDFFNDFYIGSVCPLGFVKDGKNLNYYDDKALQEAVLPFIISSVEQQISWGLKTDVAFILGGGDNFKFFKKLNQEKKWFKEVVALPHPRYILQYKRKKLDYYLDIYLETLSA